ncbi:MAG: endonuclease domain-containing protein [Betaproteobacteria bacterium]|nr:endonuclease domain-containing protein [Betaproteobacteria bacterium]
MKLQSNTQIITEKRPRQLRNSATDAERLVWQHLRNRQRLGAKFRRQHALGNYIVDFVSFDAMLIVELDGGQHAEQAAYDTQRDAFLSASGFKVLRFWNSDVMTNLDGVASTIHSETESRQRQS